MNVSKKDEELLRNIQQQWPELAELLDEINSHWLYEDPIYRFYHQSFKVYALQDETKRIAEALKKIAPAGTTFCKTFKEIYQAGASEKKFKGEHNLQWTAHTRVMVEAFFHAKFFLEMAVKYGKELKAPPATLPSGWAALLCLYISKKTLDSTKDSSIHKMLHSKMPLSERKSDMPKLIHHFIKKFSQVHNSRAADISGDAMDILIQYPWPGGVREMENIMERIVILAPSKMILKKDLPKKLFESKSLRQE